MLGRSSWPAFAAGAGLLFMLMSNIAAPGGGMSYPMLVGGAVIAAAGAYRCLRARR